MRAICQVLSEGSVLQHQRKFTLIDKVSVNQLTTKKLQEWKGNPQGKAELKQMPIIKEPPQACSQSAQQNTGKETWI